MEKQEFVMNRSDGNVLFLILVAVALFAALSYAVTSSTRSGSGNANTEKQITFLSRIENLATSVRNAVLRITVGQGLQPWDMMLNNDVIKNRDGSLRYGSLGNPADPSRYLFHPQGGGVSPIVFEAETIDCPACVASNLKQGHIALLWCDLPNVGTTAKDLTMIVVDLTQSDCLAFNQRYGITATPSLTVNEGPGIEPYVTGVGPGVSPCITAGDTSQISGKQEFCYFSTTRSRNTVIFSVIDR